MIELIYVIELPSHVSPSGNAEWWNGKNFVLSFEAALHFRRAVDADRLRVIQAIDNAVVTSHSYMKADPLPPRVDPSQDDDWGAWDIHYAGCPAGASRYKDVLSPAGICTCKDLIPK